MKFPYTKALSLMFFCASFAQADDLGINVVLEGEIKPGVYGRVELSKNSHPDLVYHDPRVVIVEERVRRQPLYLHVPPGHAKKWDKHCHKYNACSYPVYFIMSDEYHEHDEHKKHKHEKKEKKEKKHKHH